MRDMSRHVTLLDLLRKQECCFEPPNEPLCCSLYCLFSASAPQVKAWPHQTIFLASALCLLAYFWQSGWCTVQGAWPKKSRRPTPN